MFVSEVSRLLGVSELAEAVEDVVPDFQTSPSKQLTNNTTPENESEARARSSQIEAVNSSVVMASCARPSGQIDGFKSEGNDSLQPTTVSLGLAAVHEELIQVTR